MFALDFAATSPEGKKSTRFSLTPIYTLLERSLSLSMDETVLSLFPGYNRPVFPLGEFPAHSYGEGGSDLKFKLLTFERNPLFREGFIWTDLILRFSLKVGFTLTPEIT